jgi:hypothetical protein
MTDSLPADFGHHPGWFGAFTRDQAPGAIPNGSPIRKVATEDGDTNPVGARGLVLGSVDVPGKGLAYFVEWDATPRCAVFVVAWKIAAITN